MNKIVLLILALVLTIFVNLSTNAPTDQSPPPPPPTTTTTPKPTTTSTPEPTTTTESDDQQFQLWRRSSLQTIPTVQRRLFIVGARSVSTTTSAVPAD